MPSWMAYDMRQMAGRFQSDGMIPEAGDVERLTELLGRPLRSYRDFAAVSDNWGRGFALVVRGGVAAQPLDAGLLEAAGPVPEADRKQILAAGRESPALRALLALALVLLAFAVVAAASTFR